jgi:hypothetical protein
MYCINACNLPYSEVNKVSEVSHIRFQIKMRYFENEMRFRFASADRPGPKDEGLWLEWGMSRGRMDFEDRPLFSTRSDFPASNSAMASFPGPETS